MTPTHSIAFQVHEEDLDDVRDEAIATLVETRSIDIPQARYDWLYRDNPDGPAVLWSIREEATGEMAGFSMALPRRVLVDGRRCVCWNGGDLSVRPQFRRQGAATQLRVAAMQGVDAGRVDFFYNHPNAQSQPVYEKAGYFLIGTMVRYAKPLKTEEYIRRRLGGRLLAAGAGKITDSVLMLSSRERRHRTHCSTRVIQSPRFDQRFDALFAAAATGRRIVGVRDARYLDWRYTRNPLYKTQAILAEQRGELAGYVLFSVDDAVVHVRDLFTSADSPAGDDLVVALIDHARRMGKRGISAIVLEDNPLERSLIRFGFRRREDSSQMTGYAPAERELRPMIADQLSWFLTVGDRDV